MNKKKYLDKEKWYKEYYEAHYKNKNIKRDDLFNKETLFQQLASKKCFINSLSKIYLNKNNSRIIDIGCGSSSKLIDLVSLGFNQKNLYGIDINESDINFSKMNYPLLNLSCQNATKLDFKDNFFDLTYESTMFVQITNEEISENIAREMVRVTKKNGFIIIFDWRFQKFKNPNFLACDQKRIQKMFSINKSTKLISRENGMLIPPLGRFLSKYMSSSYFVVAKVFPFFVGHVSYILQKN